MPQDVSSFGSRIRLIASKTFPAGITLSQFADDADPFDAPVQTITDGAMGPNGDYVTWSTANPILVTFNLIPGSDDDRNMDVVAEANRVGRGKFSALDIITLTVLYPDGSQITYAGGKLLSAIPGRAMATSGRQKAKPYAFGFESKTQS